MAGLGLILPDIHPQTLNMINVIYPVCGPGRGGHLNPSPQGGRGDFINDNHKNLPHTTLSYLSHPFLMSKYCAVKRHYYDKTI